MVQPELLILVEQFYIDSYNFHDDLYNSLPTAGNHLGYKHSEETKNKMSLTKKGKYVSPQSCRNMAEAQRGNTNRRNKSASNETRKRISLSKMRFNEKQISEIKKLRSEGISCINIGKIYNCDRRLVYKYLKL